MTLNKRYRRQTWLINLLILMLLVVGGLGVFGLAQSQVALETIYAQRVVAMAQLAQRSGPATASTLVQQQADMAREDLADAARLHVRLRAAILLTIVLGIGCASACGSGRPRYPVRPAQTEPTEAELANEPATIESESPPSEPPAPVAHKKPADWDGSNRRGPNRARNVARIPKKPATPDGNATHDDRTDATDEWEPF